MRKSKVTQDSFVERSKVIHNNKYDYSKSTYIGYRDRLTIVCPIHGDFLLTPANHLSTRRGCPLCVKNIRLTTPEFIKNAVAIHGNRYDYSLVEYINSSTLVKIICKKHGEFLQSPTNHVHDKNGCPLCKSRYIPTTVGFIEKAQEIHGQKYNYENVIYKQSDSKVNIQCKLHGDFMQAPEHHINGGGCQHCAINTIEGKLRQSVATFIDEANKIYGAATYNYSDVYFDNFIVTKP